jgi:5-methylcytosine-specific restriction endonuclease McrA
MTVTAGYADSGNCPSTATSFWSDPLSASLDHVIPLVANGEHGKASTQLAHWVCNVRNGAKMDLLERR